MIEIDRYPHSRFWAIHYNGELLAVTVYKKGALAIAATLQGLIAKASPVKLHPVRKTLSLHTA
jgi:hypothetical protein